MSLTSFQQWEFELLSSMILLKAYLVSTFCAKNHFLSNHRAWNWGSHKSWQFFCKKKILKTNNTVNWIWNTNLNFGNSASDDTFFPVGQRRAGVAEVVSRSSEDLPVQKRQKPPKPPKSTEQRGGGGGGIATKRKKKLVKS